EDSLSDEAYALCCQPLEVGLASEARSTTRRWRRRKDDDEDEKRSPCIHQKDLISSRKEAT
ncbi:MAG: hypothetical protein WAM44_14855, partial [Chthoniobacterales bacterium]